MASSFKQHLESQGKSQSTVKHYMTYLYEFLAYIDKQHEGKAPFGGLGAKEVMSFLQHLQKRGQENKTRSIRLGVIKQFFAWQLEKGQRDDNPIQHLKIQGTKTKKLYPLFTSKELEELYARYAQTTENDPNTTKNWFKNHELAKERNKVILSLFIHQGITTAEVQRLEVQDLKLREGEIYIAGTRTSNARTLKLESNQILDLMEYSYQTRKTLLDYQVNKVTKRLFLSVPTAGQTRVEKDCLDIFKGFSKELKTQNPKYINFQQIRTSVITKWLKQHNLRQVQYMAGHRYISSTEAYLVNQIEDLQTDVDKFHPF